MAKVFASPIPAPVFNVKTWREDMERYTANIVAYTKDRFPNDLYAGTIMQFPVADGYAQYVVACSKPLKLYHLDVLDGYQIPEAHARGLNLADVKKQIAWNESWNKLAAQKGFKEYKKS